jgi:hypothetical protein
MKKLLFISFLISLTLTSCIKDEIYEPIVNEVPQILQIEATQGIKLESTIVTDEVKMNVKLPYDGTYRIKIRDIGRTLVSQEELLAKAGDNILKVYVKSLPKDGYTIELVNSSNEILGLTSFIVN